MTEKYEQAMEMAVYLARYFQYVYKNIGDFVVLEDELDNVRTYLEIQKLGRPKTISYVIHKDDTCTKMMVPPLMILTFVENSIKYGENQDHTVYVEIEIKSIGGNTIIQIRDHGPGFIQEILHGVENKEKLMNGERECVGITNVLERLQLLYDNMACVRLYNNKGAVVEICIKNSN